MSKKIITGVKPTGSSMHLGNLMGAVLPFANVAAGNDAAIFIADLHAITSVKNGKTLREQTLEVAIEYLSIFGIDTPITIFRQSDIVDITRLMWILTNVTPYSLMNRAHSFKETEQRKIEKIDEIENKIKILVSHKNYYKELKENKPDSGLHLFESIMLKFYEWIDSIDTEINELNNLINSNEISLNMWVFNYPILMAADIIGYDCEAVPVGKDQIQHLEMTRDIARAFNKTYGQEVFIEPEAIIAAEVATLPGIDGRKMSKSYDNFIGIFDDEKTMKKRVMSITTGSEWIDEKKKNPDDCNVFNLYKVFASTEEIAALRVKYESENIGFGYGHAKTELLMVLQRYLAPYRATREKLLLDIPFVEAKLAEWAKIMNARLEAKMKVVREVVGVN
jgi:tryptophanyl-tRNA synthetase